MHAFPGVSSPTSSLSLNGAVTIDVEEWFHAHNLGVPPHEWANIPSRVEIGLDRLSDIWRVPAPPPRFLYWGGSANVIRPWCAAFTNQAMKWRATVRIIGGSTVNP